MGGNSRERLGWKEEFHSLGVELERDYGLSPVASRALLRRIEEFVDEHVLSRPEARGPGQVCYFAVAVGERAGKPIRYCQTIPARLTVYHESDAEVLHELGSPALRRVRLQRMSAEAFRQGGVLSHEDLALLLSVDLSTVRRAVKECAEQGNRPVTRGVIEDIGPGRSHKEQVIALYFRGMLAEHIAARTGHRLGSVERYLSDFARVVHLKGQGLKAAVIERITGLSPKIVRSYLSLAGAYDKAEHRGVMDRLVSRFGPLEEVGDE